MELVGNAAVAVADVDAHHRRPNAQHALELPQLGLQSRTVGFEAEQGMSDEGPRLLPDSVAGLLYHLSRHPQHCSQADHSEP